MALRHCEVNGGQGQVVDVALYEAVFAMMESMVPEFDVFGFIRERSGNIMPGITPSSIHTSSDGKHVQIGANGDAIFQRFMRAIARDDLANDPTLADNAGRDTRRDELYGVIDRWASSQPLEALLNTLSNAEVPASRIYSAADMLSDPQFLAREMFLSAKLPDGKPFKMPGIVPKLSETPGAVNSVGPQLGEHNSQVLTGLGYSSAQIIALRRDGAI
jgi:formyl-CoA transferase